jgi:NitT/TauT family transport system ATP-binding protein
MSGSQIAIAGVGKVFGTDVVALENIDLQIPAGQFVCLLGPSGCGKSTLLNAIAGFSPPSSGSILVQGPK